MRRLHLFLPMRGAEAAMRIAAEVNMYHALKSAHVFAVIIFMGNIITGLFWKMHADATRDRAIIRHTMHGLIRADRWFTIPGVLVLTAAGVSAAIRAGLPLLHTHWIAWSIGAFSLSGAAFAWKVAPLQKELLLMTGDDTRDLDWNAYRSKSRQWEMWGLLATITPAIAVILMTAKPA